MEEFFERDRNPVTLLVAISVLLFFFGLGGRDLWAPDEGEYAEISQEMLQTGDWVVPRINDHPTAQKPPLFNWAVAVISLPWGKVTELTARLPSAIGGLVGVLATYWLGMTLFGSRKTALFSAMALATSPIYFNQARWVQVDMLLSTFVLLSLSFFFYGYKNVQYRQRAFLVGSICIGLGLLTKGPIAIILPFLTVALFLALQGQIKEFLNKSLLLNFATIFAVSLPWYLASYHKGGADFTRELIIKHNFQMFLETWSHKQPFYYYFLNLPWVFFPWMVFLPAAVYHLYLNKEEKTQWNFLFAWAVGMFCFFSLSQAKQAKYLLPMLPSLALITGRFWEEILLGRETLSLKKWVLLPCVLMVIGTFVGGLFILKWAEKAYPEYLPFIALILSFLVLLWGSVFFSFIYGRRWTALITLVVGLTMILFYYQTFIQRVLNPLKSLKPFCQQTVKGVKDRPLGIFGINYNQMGPYLFYTERRFKTFTDQKALTDFLSAKERVFCIISDLQLTRLKNKKEVHFYTLLSVKIGRKRVHLISNHSR